MTEQKPRPFLSTPIKIVIVVFLLALAAVAFYFWPTRLSGYMEETLISDNHVTAIRIDKEITIDNINYSIKSLSLGDDYSVLCIDADGMSIVPPINGAKLYQGGQILPYITAMTSNCSNSAIAFAHAESDTNLELHIDTIDYLQETSISYPLEFNAAKAVIDVNVLDIDGTVTVVLTEDGHKITSKGLESLQIKKEYGNDMPLEYTLSRNGSQEGEFCIDYPPTHVMVTVRQSVYQGYTIVIPIS